MTDDSKTDAGVTLPAAICSVFRPKTRGELRDCLKAGETCEVVATNAAITDAMLRGWLEFDGYKIERSPNVGWALFIPQNKGDHSQA